MSLSGLHGYNDIAQYVGIDFAAGALLHRKGDHIGGLGALEVSVVEFSYSRIVRQEDAQFLFRYPEYL